MATSPGVGGGEGRGDSVKPNPRMFQARVFMPTVFRMKV